MTNWTDIPVNQIDPGSPGTQGLFTALRDNPVAAAEGAVGAPIQGAGWHPFDALTVGDGATGLIYDFAADGGVREVETPVFEDGYEYMLRLDSIAHSSGSARIDFEAKGETGGFFNVSLFDVASGAGVSGDVIYHAPRVVRSFVILEGRAFDGTNAFSGGQVGLATPQRLTQARIQARSDITAGKVFFLRRREYSSG